MVRRRVEIKAIEDKAKRHTTFTKRRQGLFKKVKDLCYLCDAEAAVIVFSKAGNLYGFGHPEVDDVVDRYLADHSSSTLAKEDADNAVQERVFDSRVVIEEADAEAMKRIDKAMETGRPAWDEMVRDVGLSEVYGLESAMKESISKVAARRRELEAGGGNIPVGGYGG
ncbi:hypothetical protein BUALT_Bualt10G0063300 [Buddleja alternifolia]|uniref:MADS-box domain-containing protein n=1 Tax=Buddleja alternifolia TaxID=168488 RepID=A0AAV6X7F1_9LAMI|nr:hypothetical protein BUALT_Bualt10G0063300 [Buddleja alternifolia]